MKTQKHGLSVEINRVENEFLMTLKAVGTLTHDDYEGITPMIDSALAEVPNARIKALVDGTELKGWELRAAWDDIRLGLKHRSEFEKVAIYGNKKWQKAMATMGTWFISGDMKFFESEPAAVEWLAA